MSNSPLDFLGADAPGLEDHVDDAAAADPVAASVPETPAEPAPGLARGSDGRFAPAATEPPAAAAPAPAPATPVETGHVPLSAMLDEREKRQAAERRLADIDARDRAAAQANATPPPLEEQVRSQLYAANLTASRRFAEREYGKDVISTVHDWVAAKCDADPLFNQQMRSSDDPYEAAAQAYNREQVLATVGASDLEQFKAWKAAQATAQAQAAPAPAVSPPSPPVAIPRSLATAPGSGPQGRAGQPVGEGNAYAGLFK